jgi:outer membrane protein
MRSAASAVLILLLVSSTAEAQEPAGKPIALSDALQVAVRQHPTLAEATIDVRVADAQLLAASGLDDWLLEASGVVAFAPDRVSGTETQTTTTIDLEASLTKPLPTGGAVGLTLGGGWSDAPSFSAGTGSRYESDISLFASHSLLRGRGRDVARADQARARSAREVAVRAKRAAAIIVIEDVVSSYWELVFATRSLEIRRGSLELANERLRRIRAGIAAGATAGIEEVQVDQTAATREGEVVSAEVDVVSRSLALRRAAGLPIGPGEIELRPVAPLTAEPGALEFDALYQKALAANPQLAVLEARAAGIEIDVRVAEDAMRARLDATVTAGLSGIGDSPGASAEDLVKFNGWSVTARLDYQQSLGNHAARGARERANAERDRLKVQIDDQKRSTAEALARAVALARSAARRAELSAKVVKLAEQSIEAEKARERLGRATSFDVAEREEELAQAQLSHTRATIDYLVAAAGVDALTGDILTRWGITLDVK